MIQAKVRFAILMIPVFCAAFSVQSAVTEFRWIGGARGDWGDGANWDQGRRPDKSADSHVIFDHGSDVTVVFTNATDRIGKLAFLSGNTVIESPNETRTLYSDSSTFVIDASEGASGAISNVNFYTWSGKACRKTGAGTFTCFGEKFDPEGSRSLTIEEGVFRKLGGGVFNVTNITVKSGAELVYGGKVNVTKTVPWVLEEGALVTLLGGANAKANGIQGKGNVVVEENDSPGVLFYGDRMTTESFLGTVSGGPVYVELASSYAADDSSKMVILTANQWRNARFRRAWGLGFAPGVGTFRVGGVDGYYGAGGKTIRLEDTDGNPVTLIGGGYNFDGVGFSGTGSFYLSDMSTTLSADKYLATGILGVYGTGKLTLPSALDLSETATIAGLDAKGGQFVVKSSTDVDVPLTGILSTLQLESPARTLRNVDLVATNVNIYGTTQTFSGKRLVVDSVDQTAGSANYNVIAGGRVYATPVTNSYDTATSLLVPGFVKFSGSNGSASLKVTGGEVWYAGGWGNKHILLTGGRLHLQSNFVCDPSGSAKSTLRFDGGEAVVEARGESFEFEAKSDVYRNYVGKGGFNLRISRLAGTLSTSVYFYNPIEADPDIAEGTDGGVTIYDLATYRFYRPLAISGAFRLLDGILYPKPDQVTNGTAVAYGTGDFVMRNSLVDVAHELDAGVSGTLRLATGADSALVFNGGSAFLMRTTTAKGYQTITANAIRAGGKGSVLTLSEQNGYADRIGAADGDRFLVSSLAATNFVRSVPVVIDDTSGNDPHFVKYTAENGFAPIPDSEYKTSLKDVGENDIILASMTISADTHAAGAKVQSWQWLTVNTGKTLTLGNGTDPALILFKSGGGVNGSGTIDFRTNEGIFYPSYAREQKSYAHKVQCTLAGSGGVSYVGADYNNVRRMAIESANVYTGGTRINGCIVYPRNAAAFSSGDVYVGPGQYRGGRVEFDADLTFANPFHVGGWGWNRTGAFVFDANATLSGPVEFLDATRVSVTDGHVGRLAGTLSGDRLVAWSATDDGTGVLELSGLNTMTGGLEVVKATLSVTSAAALGSNDVLLDGGTLQIDNAEDCTVANEISGLGKIRLAKKYAVTFSNLKSQNDAGFTLELSKRNHTVSSLKGFSRIVAPSDRDIALKVVDDESFDGTVPSNVTIYFKGQDMPVKGMILIVH